MDTSYDEVQISEKKPELLELSKTAPYERVRSGWQALSDPGFIALYMGVGFVLAASVFSISVISIPVLVDRKVDVLTAVITSLRTVAKNPGVMFRWAFIIALLTIVGLFTPFIGLLVIIPLLGHASWHAYKQTVVE
jgi:uncharacterized membrane protein